MERIATLLPAGPDDLVMHRGARRRTARYPMHANVRVRAPETARGVVLNASAGGLRVTLDRGVRPGDELELDVRFDRDRVSHERAQVVWSRELPDGWLVGLSFVEG
jgi:PilZ domain-containing protein